MITKGLMQNKKQTEGLLNKIILTSTLRTFDFHEMEGKPQTEETNKTIHNNIINNPTKPMADGGETFEHAVHRAFGELHKIMKEKGNFVVTTHNSMWGLLKLWNEKGRPQELSKEFREEYSRQDTPSKNAKSTGEYFEIKGENGNIFCVRHGETEDNAKGIFRTAKSKLTPKGKEQAKKLGEELKNKNIKKIYTSDLPRAIETSEIINRYTK